MQSYSEPQLLSLSRTPLAGVSLGVVILIFLGIYIRSLNHTHDNDLKHGVPSSPQRNPLSASSTKPQVERDIDKYPPIMPLPDFNWETANPLVYRPFKPKYHLTMAISTLDPSELIPMDKTYKDRLELRESLLERHPDIVRALNIHPDTPEVNARIREALCEWYAFVMGTYLPTRYPRMFRLTQSSSARKKEEKDGKKGTMIENLVTGLKAPVDPEELLLHSSSSNDTQDETESLNTSLLHLLDTLSSWIDEDFLILFPNPTSPPTIPTTTPEAGGEDPQYILQAYSTYYPSGFNPREKVSLPLSKIHTPVPGYKQKLEKSMDRFFARLEVGRFVVRVNWSIMTPEARLFAAFGGLHDYSSLDYGAEKIGDKGEGEGEGQGRIQVEGFDGADTYLRCERQTLHRLPSSKAVVFAFHTYLYPIRDIKDEGLGEELAVAIDGLKEGNVPGIHAYKRGPYWGEAVKAFLRS
ncbi:heme-dependent oxidative N-demethylase family protein [Aspergillus lucknowensis]|uniref:HRQ family protein n=1 Tax=Aspergillus lucknowensis TaxID=176173 RepID=A0ABR4LRF7_9EURO